MVANQLTKKTLFLQKRFSLEKVFLLFGEADPLQIAVNVQTILPLDVKTFVSNQAIIAQWLAWWLATGVVLGSNSGKGDNL